MRAVGICVSLGLIIWANTGDITLAINWAGGLYILMALASTL
jgi:hypothetical protein